MKKRTLMTAGVGSLLASLAIAAPAGAGSQDSKIVISHDAPTFHGVVSASSKHCVEGRAVKLLKITKGRDKVLGLTATDKDGVWGIPYTPKAGNTYYAKVLRQSATGGVFCGGDRSNRIKT
jgi:hypothetical protein